MLTINDWMPSAITAPEGTLLLNIETTGLSPDHAFIYMIGTALLQADGWQCQCLLAESRMEERRLLQAFSLQLAHARHIITYGGRSFSQRFVNSRWLNYSDEPLLGDRPMTDIQRELMPYRTHLALPDLKKKTLESFMGCRRQSSDTGKELIQIYTRWELNHDDALREHLLVHHQDDMRTLMQFCRLFAYLSFWKGHFAPAIDWRLQDSCCSFYLQLEEAVPLPIHYETAHAVITLKDNQAAIDVPLFSGTLRYYLPGPVKDYAYLPMEDTAIHRSVACYVDKAYRQKATAATCYTRRQGLFLPTDDLHLEPIFQADRQDKTGYILYDPENWLKNPAYLCAYIRSLLH